MAAAAPSPTSPAPAPGRSVWHTLARVLLAVVLLLATVLGGAWGWAGSEGSLATALRLASRYLPDGMQLTVQDVSGTLRSGGQIGTLHFASPDIAVQVQDARIAWRPAALLDRQLLLTELQVKRIALRRLGEPDASPAQPLTDLLLPLRIRAPFAADAITWAAGEQAPTAISDLRGHYDWDGTTHHLRLDSIALAQGRYTADASLDGAAPMALQAALQGSVQTPVPGSEAPLAAAVQAQASGTLAGEAAQLTVSAQVLGEAGNALRLQAQARIRPWAAQPMAQAQASLQALDLAALWPQAPTTRLSGTASLQPEELSALDGWALKADLVNENPGPLDTHHLPVSALQATARYEGTLLQVPDASVHIGSGVLRLHDARFDSATQSIAAQLALQAISPARLHSLLDAAPVHGSAQITGRLDGALQLQAKLSAAPAQSRTALHLDHLDMDGQWQDGRLHLRHLAASALQARIDGQALAIDIRQRSGSGKLTLRTPGASLQADGEMAPRSGRGQFNLALQDAQALQRWLAALPLPLPHAITQAQITGKGELHASWQGGWQTLLEQAQASGKRPSTATALQASLRVPQLSYTPLAGETLVLNGLQAQLDATPTQATLALDGSASHGTEGGRIRAMAHLRSTLGPAGPQRWQARISEMALSARMGQRPGPWQIALQAPLVVQLDTAKGLHLQAQASSAAVTGPQPGTAQLALQHLSLALPQNGALQLQTQGSLKDVPLVWANAADSAQPPLLQRLGLAGDVVLGGSWDVTLGQTLQAQVTLARSSGDLHMAIDGQNTAAGLQQAQLTLQAQDGQLVSHLAWKSERAGQITAQAQAPLQHSPEGGWRLASDAALTGALQAALPDIGVWSLLAPPGWRINGSLGANVQLSGALNAPRLNGEISADDLALRSVLDGVDLRDGRLRARLAGDSLTITELRLAGGHSSGARILGPSGNLTKAPKDGGSLTAAGAITWQGNAVRMDVNATADALQVLVRADRQLSLSGTLKAQLANDQLQLTGKLRADRASILLPDDSTPTLGDDVVVHSAGNKAKESAAPAPPSQAQPAKAPVINITFDLGNDFAVQGHGLTTRLKGELMVTSNGAQGPMPRVLGEIRTEQGRYRAWSQMLDVETGLVRFSGAMDNPQLDILALRPQISERVGVQVSGTARAPRVRLYSDPDMPDAEKLSWLVLGRSAAAGGADAALMQQAALALLSGGRDPSANIAQRLGLDEIGFRGPSAGDADNAASGAALTLGKRISRDLYVTYEHSLAGTVGTLFIFLDLSKRLTLRGQTGTQSAIDLIYTIRYD